MPTSSLDAARDRSFLLPATDGFQLAASEFTPAAARATRIVVVAPATGVRRGIYRALATFLAERGAAVVTWDWRGTGESRPASLRGFAATMHDWAEKDFEGVVQWARAAHPGLPLHLIGHSFGGQALGFVPGASAAGSIVTLAAQSGYLGHWPLRLRLPLYGLWYVLMPGVTRALGYFPSRRLGFGEDLPRGVALEWAGWCRRPGYHDGWEGHQRLVAPVLGFSFDDDPIAPRRAVDVLHAEFGGRVVRRHLSPGQLGVRRLGHFEFLRPGVAPVVWEEIAAWLEAAEPGDEVPDERKPPPTAGGGFAHGR